MNRLIAALRAKTLAATPGPRRTAIYDPEKDPVELFRENLSHGTGDVWGVILPEVVLALCDAAERGMEAERERDELRAEIAKLRCGLAAVEGLIADSHGVDGLHLNGDVAPWEELRSGGRYEGWLRDFDAALAAHERKDG